eukprot:TRINITY_DN2800_c0_g2_i1.p1 TRINITY_DN2800_c0_g2~~TRINITY_DN2800_c0_g2_i1.p1  ORF type:complete len:269 (-),score=22.62 TRINITY_DN2800_c0_g2_i1:88-840(-)
MDDYLHSLSLFSDESKQLSTPSKKADEENDICCICFGPFVGKVTILPCQHKFHSSCIRSWYLVSGTCPYDRSAIPHQLIGEIPKSSYVILYFYQLANGFLAGVNIYMLISFQSFYFWSCRQVSHLLCNLIGLSRVDLGRMIEKILAFGIGYHVKRVIPYYCKYSLRFLKFCNELMKDYLSKNVDFKHLSMGKKPSFKRVIVNILGLVIGIFLSRYYLRRLVNKMFLNTNRFLKQNAKTSLLVKKVNKLVE